MADYQVDPDDVFSEEDSPPLENAISARFLHQSTTSSTHFRPQPTPQTQQSALRPLSLPPLGKSSFASRPKLNGTVPHYRHGTRPYESRPHRPRIHEPRQRDSRSSESGYRSVGYSREPPSRQARPVSPPKRKDESPPSEQKDSLTEAASILPEHTREKVLREEEKRRAAAASERKRPSRKRRSEDPAAKKAVLQNAKRSRQGQSFGLASLLAAASNSSSLIKLDPNRNKQHRDFRSTNERAVYAGVTMTKERKEREERERREAEQRRIDEEQAIDDHFRQMRIQERNERRRLSKKWRTMETVAADMRHAYRLAKIERTLFDPKDKEMASLQDFGLKLQPMGEDPQVTEMWTIEIEDI
ncbi:unnamed protein product [Agarophyton chilense]|eukprot:gb/GEZJ01004543.1/.p1 GENE.gb/GEZJ01004543.1/~~gb/GEZJ01004543.1/.p1  ORF type:complete len:358 (+),score=63.39 gb/GEZJ01004543.1/:1879-2952(+)